MSKFQRFLLAMALFASVVGACGCATCDSTSTSREPPPFVAEATRRFRTSADLDADLVYSPNDDEPVVVVGVSFRAAER